MIEQDPDYKKTIRDYGWIEEWKKPGTQNLHKLDGPARVLYMDGIKCKEEYWVNGQFIKRITYSDGLIISKYIAEHNNPELYYDERTSQPFAEIYYSNGSICQQNFRNRNDVQVFKYDKYGDLLFHTITPVNEKGYQIYDSIYDSIYNSIYVVDNRQVEV